MNKNKIAFKNNKNEEGYILALVIVMMMVLSIFLVSTLTVVDSNTNEVRIQENNMRAFYLSKAGIDIAYAALSEDIGGGELAIVKLFREDKEIDDELELPLNGSYGKVKIKVFKNPAIPDPNEVIINAVTNLDDNSGKSDLSLILNITDESGFYRINYDNARWERNYND